MHVFYLLTTDESRAQQLIVIVRTLSNCQVGEQLKEARIGMLSHLLGQENDLGDTGPGSASYHIHTEILQVP